MPVAIDYIVTIAREAGKKILEISHRGANVRLKKDCSPVTDADEAANKLIVGHLRSLTPDIPILAEESAELSMSSAPRFWLVDPLDGTREFIDGRDEYTVNIALIESGNPVLGVVLLPARQLLYAGVMSEGAWRQHKYGPRTPISTRFAPETRLIAVASRSHSNNKTNAWLKKAGVAEVVRAGSSLKFCLIAEGSADIYPRLGRTMEWDTAAAHAVLQAAGGSIVTLSGEPLTYGKPGFDNPHFVARGHP